MSVVSQLTESLMSFRAAALIFLGFCQLSFATINRECLTLIAHMSGPILDYSQPKELTFPPVNEEGQKTYLAGLKDVIRIEGLPVRNQPYLCCNPNCFATLLDLLARTTSEAPRDRAPISANYLARGIIAQKASEALQEWPESFPVIIGSTDQTLAKAIDKFGLATQEAYPDRSDVNTKAIVREINRLVEAFLAYKYSVPAPPHSVLETYLARVKKRIKALLDKNFAPVDEKLLLTALALAKQIYWEENGGSTLRSLPYSPEWGSPSEEGLEAFFRFLVTHEIATEITHYFSLIHFDKNRGAYASLLRSANANAKPEEEDLIHGIVLVGMARDKKSNEAILILQNSHGSPALVFMPMSFYLVFGHGALMYYRESNRKPLYAAFLKIWNTNP